MGVCNWQQAVEEVPQSLVRELEGNDSMRSKFEALCRKAQNDICKRIEELDGEGKVSESNEGRRRGKERQTKQSSCPTGAQNPRSVYTST